jgi:hypothetical protein
LAFKGELSSPVSDRLLKAMEGAEAADLAKVEAVSVSAEVEAPWWNYEAKNNETPASNQKKEYSFGDIAKAPAHHKHKGLLCARL